MMKHQVFGQHDNRQSRIDDTQRWLGASQVVNSQLPPVPPPSVGPAQIVYEIRSLLETYEAVNIDIADADMQQQILRMLSAEEAERVCFRHQVVLKERQGCPIPVQS